MLTYAAALILGTLATARATRLAVHDGWPPAVAVRLRWLTWAAQTPRRQRWADLLDCPFCFAPYAAAVTLTVAIAAGVWTPDLTTVAGWWWTLAVWASTSYAAAMIVVRDTPPEEG